jgi:hypothetical protein
MVETLVVASCGGSGFRDSVAAFQHFDIDTLSGSINTLQGLPSKATCGANEQFRKNLDNEWATNLPSQNYAASVDANGKTEVLQVDGLGRSVYVVDFTTVLLQYMAFAEIHEKFIQSPLASMGMWPGKTPYGLGSWERLAHITHGGKVNRVWDLDVKKMEASIRWRDLRRMARIFYRCLKPQLQDDKNWARVWSLFYNLSESIFGVPDNKGGINLFWKGAKGYGGQPSGHYLTAMLNCLEALFLLLYAYVRECTKRHLEPNLNKFMIGTKFTIMGDDIQLSFSAFRDAWWRMTGRNGAEALAVYALELNIVFECTNWDGLSVWDARFCGMQFLEMKDPVHWVSFSLDHDRQLCAIQQGGDPTLPIKQLQRIGSLYNVVWPDIPMREIVLKLWFEFINRMQNGYTDDKGVYHPPHPHTLTDDWEAAKTARSSERELRNRFCGFHTASPGGGDEEFIANNTWETV